MLPKFRDGWTYLYVEHCRVDQQDKSIAIHDVSGRVPVPCSSLSLLLLGPGTTVTHAAMRALAENGCSVMWCGEEAVRVYAQGLGETRKAYRLLRQAELVSDPDQRLRVAMRLYEMRFGDEVGTGLSIRELRGREGARVRDAYARASRETGVPWRGRNYDRGNWGNADPVNRALSCANSCLYGICHAGIVSSGFSPALGFIHTGRMLSFVYDIADLYKTEIAIPIAFGTVAESSTGIETRVRKACRDAFRDQRLLSRIVPDIETALGMGQSDDVEGSDPDTSRSDPGRLWDPDEGAVEAGVSWDPRGQTGGGNDDGAGT